VERSLLLSVFVVNAEPALRWSGGGPEMPTELLQLSART